MSEPASIYGKYRGMVLNNIDPMQQGRLQVQVPDVAGLIPTTWAMPCVPVAGIQNGMFALPIIGSGVWVEFEQGDPDYPIWVGCFWGSAAEVPALALLTPPGMPAITLQTPLQNGLTISDLPGPDRRHHAQERHRRDAHRQRHRHLHPERQGRDDHAGRPDASTINNGALTVSLTMPGPAPSCRRHRALRPRRHGDADRAQSARAGERPADGGDGRALRDRRLPVQRQRRRRCPASPGSGSSRRRGCSPTASRWC